MNISRKIISELSATSPKTPNFTIQHAGSKLGVQCSPAIRDELIKKGIESNEITLPGLFVHATKNSLKNSVQNIFAKIIK